MDGEKLKWEIICVGAIRVWCGSTTKNKFIIQKRAHTHTQNGSKGESFFVLLLFRRITKMLLII